MESLANDNLIKKTTLEDAVNYILSNLEKIEKVEIRLKNGNLVQYPEFYEIERKKLKSNDNLSGISEDDEPETEFEEIPIDSQKSMFFSSINRGSQNFSLPKKENKNDLSADKINNNKKGINFEESVMIYPPNSESEEVELDEIDYNFMFEVMKEELIDFLNQPDQNYYDISELEDSFRYKIQLRQPIKQGIFDKIKAAIKDNILIHCEQREYLHEDFLIKNNKFLKEDPFFRSFCSKYGIRFVFLNQFQLVCLFSKNKLENIYNFVKQWKTSKYFYRKLKKGNNTSNNKTLRSLQREYLKECVIPNATFQKDNGIIYMIDEGIDKESPENSGMVIIHISDFQNISNEIKKLLNPLIRVRIRHVKSVLENLGKEIESKTKFFTSRQLITFMEELEFDGKCKWLNIWGSLEHFKLILQEISPNLRDYDSFKTSYLVIYFFSEELQKVLKYKKSTLKKIAESRDIKFKYDSEKKKAEFGNIYFKDIGAVLTEILNLV